MLRGIKTLAVRLQRSIENARAVARFLAGHPAVSALYWPEPVSVSSSNSSAALNKPQAGSSPPTASSKLKISPEMLRIHAGQASGPGSLLSFCVGGDVDFAKRFCQACRIFKITVSWDGNTYPHRTGFRLVSGRCQTGARPVP